MRYLPSILIAASIALSTEVARADFYLVVHNANPQRALTQKEALDLYMGRSHAFSGGQFATMFDLPRDHPQRAAFYQALTNLNIAQVNSHWARLTFAGQGQPPQVLPDENAMRDVLKQNPSALGWLSKEPTDKQLRTVLVLKEPQ